MTAKARFDLKMDAVDKDVVSRAAALMGTTMAGFVRAAAKEKALALLDRESRVMLSKRDFAAFTYWMNFAKIRHAIRPVYQELGIVPRADE